MACGNDVRCQTFSVILIWLQMNLLCVIWTCCVHLIVDIGHISDVGFCACLPLYCTETECFSFFTALHVMQTRYREENSVCLSVCLSVTRVHCDKTVERSVQIFIPYERIFILLFWEEEWLVGSDPFYLKFWVNRPPLERNRQFSTNNRS